jgi:phenylpyruvate tautomerase PptA (4-oxalocrotonate tautomerase family)
VPLVTIDLLEGRPAHELDAIAATVHETMHEHRLASAWRAAP